MTLSSWNSKGLKDVPNIGDKHAILRPMAEAFARLHGNGKLETSSAGHHPSERIDDGVVRLAAGVTNSASVSSRSGSP